MPAWIAFLRAHSSITRRLNADLQAHHGLTLNDYEVLLHLSRAVLALRRGSPALHHGGLELLDDAPGGVLAYERSAGDDPRRVWVNFAGAPATLPEGWVVELATADTGSALPPDAAAVLGPR